MIKLHEVLQFHSREEYQREYKQYTEQVSKKAKISLEDVENQLAFLKTLGNERCEKTHKYIESLSEEEKLKLFKILEKDYSDELAWNYNKAKEYIAAVFE